jgi:hypothetical protein
MGSARRRSGRKPRDPIRRRRAIVAGTLVAVLVLLPASARPFAQPTATAENVIAAFLFNFARFTQWPPDALAPSAPIALCVADDRIGQALEQAASGRKVNGRPVVVRRVTASDSLQPCGLVFIDRSESESLPRVLASLGTSSVLTVSDAEDFATQGGMVQLYVEDGRMRFAINLANARAARLTLSAQLLNLARIVGG